MPVGLKYDNIPLPKKVSEMLEHDFWIIDNVSPSMVKAVTSPVKFSAFTSIFLREGSCKADINLITYNIKAPCIVNIPSTHIMQPYNISEDFRASFVVMSKRMTDAVLANINDVALFGIINRNPIVNINERVASATSRLYSDLLEISEQTDNERPFQTMLHTILAFFYRWGINCYTSITPERNTSFSNHIVEKFLLLVQENFKKERFLEYYAEKLEITTKHLSRTVKSQTGYSAVEWINRFVILEAKVMLSSSNLNIQQISEELNFPTQSFFGKYFKKATGMTPKEFRNKA